MPLPVEQRKINKVFVVDDNAYAREAMAECVIDASLKPIIIDESLPSMKVFIQKLIAEPDAAAIFDHHLMPGNYAVFTGAEAVASLYQHRFPALLVTAWSSADIDNIRRFRRFIPTLIQSGDAEADTITHGLQQCLQEFDGRYAPERKPWRTLVRVEDISRESKIALVNAVIPAWNPNQVVRFPLDLVDRKYHEIVNTGIRFFAQVNIGAVRQDDLFFEKFELAEKPRGNYANLIHS
jgi:hypothetical protein